jgi:hypothetical protein
MLNSFRNILPVLAATLLAACSLDSKYSDVSSDPKFAQFVGKSCRSTHSLILHGNARDYPKDRSIAFFSLTSEPGYSNRFVSSRERIAPGADIRVIGVRKCTNCAHEDVDFVVLMKGHEHNQSIYADPDIFLAADGISCRLARASGV